MNRAPLTSVSIARLLVVEGMSAQVFCAGEALATPGVLANMILHIELNALSRRNSSPFLKINSTVRGQGREQLIRMRGQPDAND
jgi:hypothetical protein